MRNISSATNVKLNTQFATEPQLILQINFAITRYFGYKTFTLGSMSVEGRILNASSLATQLRVENTSDISTVSVELDDSDNSLKGIVNTEVIEGSTAIIYHYFDGLSQSDLTEILRGKVTGDITWSEGERTLSLSIETSVEDGVVGYAPKEGDIANLWSEAVGVPWPIVFGTALKVPAVRIRNRQIGRLIYGINSSFTEFQVEKGSTFPQGTPIQIQIGSIRFNGSFTGDIFTITEANVPYYTNIQIAQRKINDNNYNDASVIWLPDNTTVKLPGLYCLVNHPTHGWMINRCFKQEGNKCFFIKPWRPANTTLEVKLSYPLQISEAAPVMKKTWPVPYAEEYIARWDNSTWYGIDHEDLVGTKYVLQGSWTLPAGSEVKLVAGFTNLYVANLLPSTEVLEVYGHRQYRGERVFMPIPKSYYNIDLSNSLAGWSPTTVEFPIALEDYIGEAWEGDVHVSMRSTVGPNVVDVLAYLITNWSTISYDSSSFNTVRSQVANYPVGFALLDFYEVLNLIQDIAWQARCALIFGSSVKLKYLSIVPTSSRNILESDVLLKSMSLGFTDTEDIYTRLLAEWQEDYEREPKKLIYTNNLNKYGLKETTRKFFIYNIESLVKLSAYFWGYRYSNTWRKVNITTLIKELDLEAFDAISMSIPIFSANTILGNIDLVNHDAISNEIVLSNTMASRAGDASGGEPTQNDNYYLGDPSYPVGNNPYPGDVGAGRQQTEYVVPTQGQTNSDPGSDTGGTGSGSPDSYLLRIDTSPAEVERGVGFTFTVSTVDSLGNIVPNNVAATLQLTSTDTDSLSQTNISIINGQWSGVLTITGGTGVDSGDITVGASGYTSVTSPSFNIIDARSASLLWTGIPASVSRGVVIPDYTLSGGLSGEVIDIQFSGSDSDDILYDSSGSPITQVTLGAGGSYVFSGTIIKGGRNAKVGTISAVDNVQMKYQTTQSTQFPITGAYGEVISQINFSETSLEQMFSLVITPPANIQDITPFNLKIEILDANNNRDTTATKTIRIEAFNDDTDERLTWLEGGPKASNYGGFLYAAMEQGVWEYNSCELDTSSATNIRLHAEVLYEETTYNDEVVVSVTIPYYLVAIPGQIFRGVAFDMTISAYNPDGTPKVSYSGSPIFTLFGTDLNGETISPNSTDATGWVNGVKTVSITINNGTGSKAITIGVQG